MDLGRLTLGGDQGLELQLSVLQCGGLVLCRAEVTLCALRLPPRQPEGGGEQEEHGCETEQHIALDYPRASRGDHFVGHEVREHAHGT